MYLSRNHLRTEYDISESTVNRMLRYIRNGIGTGKYPRDAILYIGGSPRVDTAVFVEAVRDREWERARG